jgi:hypothetical protein
MKQFIVLFMIVSIVLAIVFWHLAGCVWMTDDCKPIIDNRGLWNVQCKEKG